MNIIIMHYYSTQNFGDVAVIQVNFMLSLR